ncbi:uncharacterized protein [Macrobrachium rosenbergii]|uniref:uncharacterized protein n=1 Tax=Macrobrachium rosenbergii TaxID=79674 RepID=UPI0034D3A07E
MVATSSVTFCGFQTSKDSISADSNKVVAIKDIPTPTNLTDLHSFMGLVNQLPDFMPEIANTAQASRPLMSPKCAFEVQASSSAYLTLSRAPVSQLTPQDETDCDEAGPYIRTITTTHAAAQEDNASPQDTDRIIQDLRASAREDLSADGRPQLTSCEFRDFMERWGVHHLVTSPHYTQSSGHAEVIVKAVKHLILKTAPSCNNDCEDFDCGLLG